MLGCWRHKAGVGERETKVSHLDITYRGTCQTDSKATAHKMGTLEKELSG